jgi:hypothetical protein
MTFTAFGFRPCFSMPAEYGSIRVALEMARPALRHLAAAGVAGAEKQDVQLRV